MPQRLLFLVLLLFVSAGIMLAQVGKIAGTVTDKQSKEPLIGASVLVMGTTIGASTDLEGRYIIMNVSPGTYNLKVSYVGYQEVLIQNVQVTAGLTQSINFEMLASAIEVAPVTIIAERPIVEKSATNAVRIMKAEDIDKLPVRGIRAVFTLQPGVVLQNERVFIRGSRPSDVGFMIEGANTRNIVGGTVGPNDESGGSLITTIPEAVEEVLVQAGGYNAEFGGANAGIVQQSLKSGRDQYKFMLQAETDNLQTAGNKYLGGYSYGYSDYVFSASGPALTDKVRFFLAGENKFNRNYNPTFWDGGNFGVMYDDGTRGGHAGDSANVNWMGGNIHANSNQSYSLNGTLRFDYKPLIVKLSGTGGWQRTRANGLSLDPAIPTILPIQNIFDEARLPQVDQSNVLLNAKGTYFLNATSFGELTLSYLDQRRKQTDPYFGSNNLAYGDSIEAAKYGWVYNKIADPPRPYDFYGFPFNRAGTPLANYSKAQNDYLSGNLNFTSQQGRHELKAGLSYERWTIRNYGGIGAAGAAQLLTAMRAAPDSIRTEADMARMIRKESALDNYGFDEFGRPLDSGVDGPKHPIFFAMFLQDKIEFSDLIINAGLRWDYLDMDTWKVANPNDPGFDQYQYYIKADKLLKGQTFNYVEPRLGLSFPVTDRTVFHLQYGIFVQSPPLYSVYRGRAAMAQIYAGQFFFTNPVAYDIEPTRTTQYEIGFTQQFTDFASFDITGFYKDIKGQLQYDYFFVDRQIATVQNYPIYDNADFTTTKGLEFRLSVRRINRMQAQFNYTLSDARGTNSFASNAAAALNTAGIRPTAVTPLAYDQTHRGSINVDYRFAHNDGGPVLEDLGINFLFNFNSGHKFTLASGGGGQQGPETGAILNDGDSRSRQPLESINNSETPWVFSLDFRVDKMVNVGKFNLDVYFYIQNALNSQNVTNVYYRTGNAFDDGYLTNPDLSEKVIAGLGQQYVDMYKSINLADRQHQWNLNGTDLFSEPRQVRFGVRMEL